MTLRYLLASLLILGPIVLLLRLDRVFAHFCKTVKKKDARKFNENSREYCENQLIIPEIVSVYIVACPQSYRQVVCLLHRAQRAELDAYDKYLW